MGPGRLRNAHNLGPRRHLLFFWWSRVIQRSSLSICVMTLLLIALHYRQTRHSQLSCMRAMNGYCMKSIAYNQQVQRSMKVQNRMHARFTPSVQLGRTLKTNYQQNQVYLPRTNERYGHRYINPSVRSF